MQKVKGFESAKASLEMEGFIVTEKMEELVLKKQKGDISFDEFKKKAVELIGKN